MGKPTGFLEYARRNPTKRPVEAIDRFLRSA